MMVMVMMMMMVVMVMTMMMMISIIIIITIIISIIHDGCCRTPKNPANPENLSSTRLGSVRFGSAQFGSEKSSNLARCSHHSLGSQAPDPRVARGTGTRLGGAAMWPMPRFSTSRLPQFGGRGRGLGESSRRVVATPCWVREKRFGSVRFGMVLPDPEHQKNCKL